MIRTERLLLRRWREEDRPPFAAINADPRVMEHFPGTLDHEASPPHVLYRLQATVCQPPGC